MIKKQNIIFSVLLATVLVPSVFTTLQAESLEEATRLLVQADRSRGNASGLYLVNQILDITSEGEKESVMEVKVKNDDVRVNQLAPANSRGDIILMNGRRVWIFRKGVKRPLPLTPRQRLFGNALVGDILNMRYSDDYKALSIEDGEYNGKKVKILELSPKENGATYDRIRYYIDPASTLGVHAEFYALTGKLLKTADFQYHTINPGPGPRTFLDKTVINDPVIKENRTVVTYLKAKYMDFSASEFNRALIAN